MNFLKTNHEIKQENRSLRKKIISSVLLFLIFTSAFSQMKRIDSMLINIDKTNFTNILYERTTPWAKLNIFNDSINVSTKAHFEQALHELYKSSNEKKFTYYRDLRNQYTSKTNKNTVDVGIINTTFNELNYVENDEKNSALRLVNNQFQKIDNAKPAFKIKQALVISPLKEKLIGNTITYKFNNQFLFQETDKTIETLVANFDTQQNYTIIQNRAITTNSVTVNYTEAGIKMLEFVVTYTDGSSVRTSAVVQVSVLNDPPHLVENPPNQIATETFQGALGEIEYRIFYRTRKDDGSINSQASLKNPIIIIDGFDPGDERKIGYLEDNSSEKTLIKQMWYDLEDGDTNPDNNERVNLVNELREESYDVIIVNQINHTKNINGIETDIDGGADYIERNAMAHVALYQHLSSVLVQNGSSEELIIVGPSMGGQISRYALAYMEKNNIPHNTRLWVSIDSPHLGANIPVGQQAMMNLLDAFGDSVAAADFYNDRLKSVAGNQQLIEQHLPYHLPDHLNGGSPVFQQYYSNLNTNGLPNSNGYPQNLRKIAVVNGSLAGINVDVAGTEDFRVHGFARQFWWDTKVAEMNTKYMPNTGNTQQIARLWRELKPTRTATYTNNNPNGSMDIVPGGLFDTENQLHSAVMNENPDIFNFNNGISLGNAITASLAFYFLGVWGDFFESRTNKQIHSFIPTVSALGFKNPNFNWSQKLDRNLVCSNEIPFDSYFGPDINEPHTSFTEESVNWLFEELAGNPQEPYFPINSSSLVGQTSICNRQVAIYTFNPCKIPGSVSNWQVSSNLQIISSNGASITVKPPSDSRSSGWIKANFANGKSITKNIWVGRPNTPTSLFGPTTVNTGALVTYTAGSATGATSYKWYLPYPYTTVSTFAYFGQNWQLQAPGNTTTARTFTGYAQNAGYVQVMGQNDCGSGGAKLLYVQHQNSGGGGPGGPGGGAIPRTGPTDDVKEVSLYPNPAKDKVTVSLTNLTEHIGNPPTVIYRIKILDLNLIEKRFYKFKKLKNQETINVAFLPTGLYTLIIYTDNGTFTKKLLIK
ncbi:MAG: T9SS type A sorting domain-containing protein [Flavobacteriaceae bacterium]|nr:T9SS type A sorting domain-containing protein [Flavobacteriaceae bacterium]